MAGLGRRSHYRKHLTDAVLNDLPEPDETIGQRIARVVGTRGGNMFDVVVAAPLSSSKELLVGGEGEGDDDNDDDDDDACQTEEGGTASNNVKKEQSQSAEAETNNNESSELPPPQLPISIIRRTQQLAFLPTKFRKLVWIKRNDLVIVQCGDVDEEDEETEQRGFRFVITNILYKDQVKHIKSKGLWPRDPYFADEVPSSGDAEDAGEQTEGKEESSSTADKRDEQDNEPQSYEDNGIVFEEPIDDEFMVNTNRIANLCVEDSSSEEDSD